jgi:putative ABC transport system permease protein
VESEERSKKQKTKSERRTAKSEERNGAKPMETIVQDLKYGFRLLVKSPGFTAMAVIALALGIGANTAIFSVVNAVLLRPLPFKEPDRLVRMWETNPQSSTFSTSDPNFLDFRSQNQVFEEMGAWRYQAMNLIERDEPQQILATAVSASVFPMLGVTPALGRTFNSDEDRVGGNNRVIVLGDGLWRRSFGADAQVLGKNITLDSQTYTVIGVMPRDFDFPQAVQAWVPLAANASSNRANHMLGAAGRMKPGITLEQARTEMQSIATRLSKQYPESNGGWGARLASFSEWLIGPAFERTVWVLLAAVALVLLIACANVANLLLAKATTRQKEIAIRAALGASRVRLARQLLTESALLALLGGSAGLLLSVWGIEVVRSMGRGNVPRLNEVSVDPRVIAFACAAALLSAGIFGLAPALHMWKSDVHRNLGDGTRSSASGTRGRARSALVVGEIALAMVLLISAGLMMKSFVSLLQLNPGFRADHVLMANVALPASRYKPPQRAAFFRQLMEHLAAVPGVQQVGAINIGPLSGGSTATQVTIPGRTPASRDEFLSANWRTVTPGYFAAMGVPLQRGRLLNDDDAGDGRPPTLIINQTMARRWWPNEDPVGKTVLPEGNKTPYTIVGVVGDVRDVSLNTEPAPTMYFSYGGGWPSMTILVHSTADPSAVANAMREQVHSLDRTLPLTAVGSLQEAISASVAQPRFSTVLLGTFSALALLLAVVGIYGVVSYSVTQRTFEIGIRMALGAQQSDVLKLVLGHGLALVGIGVAVGLIAALASTRILKTLLFGVSATDPLVFTAIVALLAGVALLASYIPARRATRVDPMVALRYE